MAALADHGQNTVYGSGGFDLTGVAVINQTASTEGIAEAVPAVEKVWPNPATDRVCISVARAASATLHDLNGRYLAAFALQQGATVIDLSAYAAGVYILRVEGAAVKVVKR